MPTAEEAEELLTVCEFEAFEAEPMGYGRFTAPDGNFIDIPLAGYMSKGRLLWADEEADVWTGTLFYEEGEEDGFFYTYNTPFFLGFNSKFPPTIHDGLSQFGFTIRPVYEGSTGVDTTVSSEKSLEAVYTVGGRIVNADPTTFLQVSTSTAIQTALPRAASSSGIRFADAPTGGSITPWNKTRAAPRPGSRFSLCVLCIMLRYVACDLWLNTDNLFRVNPKLLTFR